MTKLPFTKMQGIGNDYIYFDCFKTKIDNPEELAIRLSDRHFGIGGDGIVLICPLPLRTQKCVCSILTAVKAKCAATQLDAWANIFTTTA